MDYSRLRAAALQGAEDEEAVTVDTRALIDKVLARYSGEWTTLRELIQNAADAQATKVTIRFETIPSTTVPLPSNPSKSDLLKHTITNHTLRRLVVQNDGAPFTKTDWGRLKRIAEGNPDETKIGAFGVGFYSVFADCEEPFVSSGSEAMAFYWKGNALFTKKSKLPEDQCSKFTTFVLDYRNTTTPLPNVLSVAQFMATSLTFVALEGLEFYIDDFQILSLKKMTSPPASVSIPSELDTRTKDGIMNVHAVDRTSSQISATYMAAVSWKPKTTTLAKVTESLGGPITENHYIKSFFSRLTLSSAPQKAKTEETVVQKPLLDDITITYTSTIFLRVTSAQIKTKVSSQFSMELERATKKPPPKIAKLAILTSTYDDTIASAASSSSEKIADVFASVLPSKKPGGRIFIGFPTMQTTGAGLHISAPSVVPTVEREAIDLNARWVRTWNVEMLRAAGIITRLSFVDDMNTLSLMFKGSLPQKVKNMDEYVEKFLPEALHILKTYSFEDSTPNSQVSKIIDESFWTSYRRPSIDVFSSRGVMPTDKVRISNKELSKFVDGIPVIPAIIQDTSFIQKLISFGLIHGITLDDLSKALEAKALDKAQLGYFLKYMAAGVLSGQIDHGNKLNLLSVAVAAINDDKEGSGEIIPLGAIRNYLAGNSIPAGMPLPKQCIPFAFTHGLNNMELDALGWEPLEIFTWIRFLIQSAANAPEEQNILRSHKFSVSALSVVSKNWDKISSADRTILTKLLRDHPVMPTKAGMRKPTESFFPSVKLFDDLPVIQNCSQLKEKLLVELGVRKTVDLETIFSRLLSTNGDGDSKWSHVDLIRYLASVKDDIPKEDMQRLQQSRIVPAEAPKTVDGPVQATKRHYKVSELFEPHDTLRELNLIVIQWPGNLRSGSPEYHFLVSLGMRLIPDVGELINLMAGPDANLRDKAMKYFTSKYALNNYSKYDIGSSTQRFLPIEGDSKALVSPRECFTNEGAAVMGFKILQKDLHAFAIQFHVAPNPPMVECVKYLCMNPPKDSRSAVVLFSYFAQRLTEIREPFLTKLKTSNIVPVGKGRLLAPRDCYLGKSSQYSNIFNFVDFGTDANTFLSHCGAKSEPTRHELADFACNEPARLLSVLQAEKYLNLLRNFALNISELQRDKALWQKMKIAPFLLGWHQIVAGKDGEDKDDDEAPMRQFKLGTAQEIVLPDDFILYDIFKSELVCAPEEDMLEGFYAALGCVKLKSCVTEDLRIGRVAYNQQLATELRKHVIERSKIFLYEYTSDKKVHVRYDAKWLEKNLQVQVVDHISLQRVLKRGNNKSHKENRSAASHISSGSCVLYIAEGGRPDLYQVGQALCQILLMKQNQQAYIFFEPFLTLDLRSLKRRGYNVDRILRAKAAEARLAEEERQKALQREQKIIQEREQEWRKQQQQVAAAAGLDDKSHQDRRMPGGFDEHDDGYSSQPSAPRLIDQDNPRKSRGFFSSITKQLGFNNSGNDDDDGRDRQTQSPPPDNWGAVQKKPEIPIQTPHNPGDVSNWAGLQKNLLDAVKATRPHGSDSVYSPPWQSEGTQAPPTYCDSASGQNLIMVAEASNGLKIFMDRGIPADRVSAIIANNTSAISFFASILVDVGSVYNLSPSALHVFYDESGETIAFNLVGSIFANLRYFLNLHWLAIRKAGNSIAGADKKMDAAVYWWVVMAHELAHNLAKSHGAPHTYYTQGFIANYHGAFVKKMGAGATATLPVREAKPLAPPPRYEGPKSLLD